MAKKVAKEEKMEKEQTTEKETRKNKSNYHEISIKIEGEEWQKAVDKAFAKKQKTVKVDGFRPGKVPRDIYEKKYGKASLWYDAAEDLMQNAYLKAIGESKLTPVARPSVDIKDLSDEHIEYVFTIITTPEVKVKKYKKLNVELPKVEVTDDEIQEQIDHLLNEYAELIVKDGEVENGDTVYIDYEGFKDGVAFEGGKAENAPLEIGSQTFVPGFEEQLIGMKSGETREINVTFPDDYAADELKGAKTVFKVTLHEIKQKQKRELDEDFFDDLAMEGVDSEEKLRENIKKRLQKQKENQAEYDYINTLLDEVANNVEVDIPEEMVEDEVENLLYRYEQRLNSQGISLDLYYRISGDNEESLRSKLEKDAYANVLHRLTIEEIAKLENIEATDEEANAEAEKEAETYKIDKDEYIKECGGIENIKYGLTMEKTIDRVKELNK